LRAYDKIHMFDVDLANGELPQIAQLPSATSPSPPTCRGASRAHDLLRSALSALYRALAEAGCSFLAIPSAFTKQTGEAHWHVLNRARAIENGAFVLAAPRAACMRTNRETFGHSLVIDPWGRVLAEGGTEPGVILARIDPAEVTAARAKIPSLQHGRRFEVTGPMAEPAHLHVVRGPA
jgi:predicted amidohydrolase